jgi:hypothetical protein
VQLKSRGDVGIAIAKDTGHTTLTGTLHVSGTVDAISEDDGGALTVDGGAAIKKTLYVGGDIVVAGGITISDALTTPSVTTGSLINVASVVVVQAAESFLRSGTATEHTLTLVFEVTPVAGDANAQFQFNLANKTEDLVNRYDVFALVEGWTDDTNLIPLFNTLCVGVPASKQMLVKFQAVNTEVHYLKILVRYKQ